MVIERLEVIVTSIEEEDKITTLLNSLPGSYDNLIISLESQSNLDCDFIDACLLQEKIRKGKQTKKNETLFLAKTNTENEKKIEEVYLTKTRKKFLSKGKMNKITCFYYNKKGHFANKCFKRLNYKKRNGEEVNQTNTEYEYLFATTLETHKDDSWYIDSGAPMHMTFNKDIYILIILN